MKRAIKIFLLWICLLSGVNCFSQKDKDRIEQLRTTFISKKLELSSSEYEKFWPVYNEYNDKVKAIRKNLRQSYHRKSSEEMSDADAEELYQLDLRSKQAEVDIHRQYSQRIKDIIGIKKMVKLRMAEEQFRREMINSIQHDKGD